MTYRPPPGDHELIAKALRMFANRMHKKIESRTHKFGESHSDIAKFSELANRASALADAYCDDLDSEGK